MLNASCRPHWRRLGPSLIVISSIGLIAVEMSMSAVRAQHLHQRDSEILTPSDAIVCSRQGQMMTLSKGPEADGTSNAQRVACADNVEAITPEVISLVDGLETSIALPAGPIDLSPGRS